MSAADGFYQWKRMDGRKQPYYIGLKDPQPFAFAGLWEHWEGGGKIIDSCAIIVTQANELVGAIHDRMPAILNPADYELWLHPEAKEPRLLDLLLQPCSAEQMIAYAVNTRVNNPKNDDWPLLAAVRSK